jgi:hypothetical protein
MKRLTCAVVLLVATNALAVGTPKPLTPEPEAPDFRISIVNLLVARYNPLGLEDRLRIGMQARLYRNPSAALRDNFLFFGFTPYLNPAFMKVGPSLELQPLSVLNLRVGLELMQWFGTFKYMQSFGSPRDDYSDSTINKRGDAGGNYVTSGAHFTFEPTLRMKFGPIALQNRFSIEYWSMNLHSGDTVFYEPTLDTLVPSNGWVITNDLDLVWISKYKFVLGARYSVVHPLYEARHYREGEGRIDNLNGHQRVGPLFAYTFFDHPYARFNKPSLIVIANWYVEHRWRTGADVSQAIPYFVLGFAFTSDLIPR